MKWITAFDLNQWAARTTARLSFPSLVADLIRASAGDINAFRFPNGEMGQVPGFDGVLEIDDGAPPYVPTGRSIWEFGTNADAISKVGADYDKRTGQVSADVDKRKCVPFVQVNVSHRTDGWCLIRVEAACSLAFTQFAKQMCPTAMSARVAKQMCPIGAASSGLAGRVPVRSEGRV